MASKSINRSIIAMKGHPFTRKSEFATHIASHLKCQLLSLEDFLDVLGPPYLQACSCPNKDHVPEDVGFQIICQIAKSHLSSGIFQHVIVDSRLSSRSHLDQLIELASSLDETRLVIIECKADTDHMYEWQTRFERYLKQGILGQNQEKWYKPKNWEDVDTEIRFAYDDDDGYKVSKLVVDPISDYRDSMGTPPFMDAIDHMITRTQDDGPQVVVYQRWRQSQYISSKESDRRRPYFRAAKYGSQNIRFCSSGGDHYIIGHNIDTNAKLNCMSCKEQVTGPAYSCRDCSFVLHKACAELLDDNNKPPKAPSHELLRSWADNLPGLSTCSSCEQGYNPNSYPCDDCFFSIHLEQRVLPTVIKHGCDEHFLCVMFAYLHPNEEHFQCKACGVPVSKFWYSCRICGDPYHYNCLTMLPDRVEHEHGSYHHQMLLKYSSQEEEEDYLCLVCVENGQQKRRDPSRWFYFCEECEYAAHLRCVDNGLLSKPNIMLLDEDYDEPTATEKSDQSWGCSEEEEEEKEDGEVKPCIADSGHYISNYMEEGVDYEAKCEVCEHQIVKGSPAYTCNPVCKFALHKECAELLDHNNESLAGVIGHNIDSVLSVWDKDFMHDTCDHTLFITHLKTKMLPTVIRHDCHPHFLSIMIEDVNQNTEGSCNGCANVLNLTWYSCKMCQVDYHYECLFKVAATVEHEHHLQHHLLLIQYSSNGATEDSFCDVCLENGDPGTRDPTNWFYSCQECTYEAHLKCVPYEAHLKCVPCNGLQEDNDDASSDETNYGD